MIILSNSFPTNMPNSEEVSQGGPANFERLFSSYVASKTPHKWIGVMFSSSKSKKMRINKAFAFPQREYYKLYLSNKYFKLVAQAKKEEDPAKILQKPISRIASLIKKEKPDVVFLNGFGLFNWVLLKSAEREGVPVAIQRAGIWTKELRIHRRFYSAAGLKIMERMERDSTRISNIEVFLNTWSRNYYQKHVAKKTDDNTVVIPLPFDFSLFNSIAGDKRKFLLVPPKRAFRIGAIARWDDIKNHKAILKLARLAKKKGLPWRFYSVTKIPDNNHLKVNKNSYENNVKVIRQLNRARISNFCRSMDLLILPSLFDVSPTVVLEAISARKPVAISPNVGYVDDFKNFGAKKWIIDFKNCKAAEKRIKKIFLKQMPRELQNQIVLKHDHERVFSSYLDLFETMAIKRIYAKIFPENILAA